MSDEESVSDSTPHCRNSASIHLSVDSKSAARRQVMITDWRQFSTSGGPGWPETDAPASRSGTRREPGIRDGPETTLATKDGEF